MAPPTKLPKELDLPTAFELTRKLVVTADAETAAPPRARLAKTLRYWLWRLGGRRRPALTDGRQFSSLADKYERDLARQRDRVAELERLTGRLQKAFDAEIAKLKAAHDRARAEWEAGRSEAAALAEAQERARLAEHKVEVLKEALDLARARTGGGTAVAVADSRFRDAKRAFARTFHPDQGGRGDADKQRMFLEFWPELERIEREG